MDNVKRTPVQRFTSNVFEREDHKRVVCLTGNCAVIVSKVLLSKYVRRYIIDIRDYWHEDNQKYHRVEWCLIEASTFLVISSPAYRNFLGNHDFRMMHNWQIFSPEVIAIVEHPHNVLLHVVCVGAARNLTYDRKVSYEFNSSWSRLYRRDETFILAAKGPRGFEPFPLGLLFSEDRLFNIAYLAQNRSRKVTFARSYSRSASCLSGQTA